MAIMGLRRLGPGNVIHDYHIDQFVDAFEAIADAYDVAVANGFVGTRANWLASLVGPPGASVVPLGSVATVADLDDIVNPAVDDVYTVDADGHAYAWRGGAWVDIGQFRGPGGVDTDLRARVDPGEDGTDGKVLGWVGAPGVPDWVDPPSGGLDITGTDQDTVTWDGGAPALLRMREVYADHPKYAALNAEDDDSPGLQAALNDIPNAGGAVGLESRVYKIKTGVVTEARNLLIEGVGSPGQSHVLSAGGTLLQVASGEVGLTFASSGTDRFDGPVVRDVALKAESGAVGGLRLYRANNWRLEGVVASGFRGAGAYGIKSEGGPTTVNQYGTLIECGAHNCQIGLHSYRSNGLVLLGGYFDGNDNGIGSPAHQPPGIGSIGIYHESGDTMVLEGTRVQFYDTGAYLLGASGHSVIAPRFEACTLMLRIGADFVTVTGGSYSNYIMGSTGTGIQIDAGAERTTLIVPMISAVTTKLIDNGAHTMRMNEGKMFLSSTGAYWIGGSYIEETSNTTMHTNANLKLDKRLYATLGIGVGNSAAASSLGTLSKKMEVFDANGNSIGFVPIYTTIT